MISRDLYAAFCASSSAFVCDGSAFGDGAEEEVRFAGLGAQFTSLTCDGSAFGDGLRRK